MPARNATHSVAGGQRILTMRGALKISINPVYYSRNVSRKIIRKRTRHKIFGAKH